MKEISDAIFDPLVWTYDEEADAAYIWLIEANSSSRIERTVDVGHGVILDLDPNGYVVGLELLHAGAAYRLRQAAGEAGRAAVREHAADLERLADA